MNKAIQNAKEPIVSNAAIAGASVIAGALAIGNSAMAALDVSGVTTGLADAGIGVGVVALAMLAVAGAGIAVKWFLGFLFS